MFLYIWIYVYVRIIPYQKEKGRYRLLEVSILHWSMTSWRKVKEGWNGAQNNGTTETKNAGGESLPSAGLELRMLSNKSRVVLYGFQF